MPTPPFNISYAAHTTSCTFLLDEQGICRRIVMVPNGAQRDGSRSAVKCVGAQYVASLDGGAAGGLVEMPRVGSSMLFARIDERGRISLVRTGVVTSFESHAGEDPFRESPTVETSAPALAVALSSAPARRRAAARRPEPEAAYPSARTQRIHALRPEDVAASRTDADLEPDGDLKTAEYRATPVPSSQVRPAPPRGVLPRRSDPKMRTAAAAATWVPAPPARGARAEEAELPLATRRRRG